MADFSFCLSFLPHKLPAFCIFIFNKTIFQTLKVRFMYCLFIVYPNAGQNPRTSLNPKRRFFGQVLVLHGSSPFLAFSQIVRKVSGCVEKNPYFFFLTLFCVFRMTKYPLLDTVFLEMFSRFSPLEGKDIFTHLAIPICFQVFWNIGLIYRYSTGRCINAVVMKIRRDLNSRT